MTGVLQLGCTIGQVANIPLVVTVFLQCGHTCTHLDNDITMPGIIHQQDAPCFWDSRSVALDPFSVEAIVASWFQAWVVYPALRRCTLGLFPC